MKEFSLVFWDFDGVIKDSVGAKSDAFERLFLPYGAPVAARVRAHHEANGGVSRFEKIPIYLNFAGEPVTAERVAEFCARFGILVRRAVIDSPWVPGVREYLERNHGWQSFILITATPEDEMLEILRELELVHCFREVHGAPKSKMKAIAETLGRFRCNTEDAAVIGDSETDLKAAQQNRLKFYLRRTPLNESIQHDYDGPMFDDLCHEQI